MATVSIKPNKKQGNSVSTLQPKTPWVVEYHLMESVSWPPYENKRRTVKIGFQPSEKNKKGILFFPADKQKHHANTPGEHDSRYQG